MYVIRKWWRMVELYPKRVKYIFHKLMLFGIGAKSGYIFRNFPSSPAMIKNLLRLKGMSFYLQQLVQYLCMWIVS